MRGAARCVRPIKSPGPIITPWELSLPGPWPGYMAPTCLMQVLGGFLANGQGGPAHTS